MSVANGNTSIKKDSIAPHMDAISSSVGFSPLGYWGDKIIISSLH